MNRLDGKFLTKDTHRDCKDLELLHIEQLYMQHCWSVCLSVKLFQILCKRGRLSNTYSIWALGLLS